MDLVPNAPPDSNQCVRVLEANATAIAEDLDAVDRKIAATMRSLEHLSAVGHGGNPQPPVICTQLSDYALITSVERTASVTLKNFRSHNVSSPRHLRHSRKSISTSLALRQDSLCVSRLPLRLSPERSRSASFANRHSNFGAFEGSRAGTEQAISINCFVSAPCSPDSSRIGPELRLDLSTLSPKKDLHSFSKQDVSSPKHLRYSPKSITTSIQLRRQMLDGYSPYKGSLSNNSPSESAHRNGKLSMQNKAPKLFDDEDDIFHGFLFQPKPIRRKSVNVEKIIRTPLTRLQHANRNYFDVSTHTWKSTGDY